MQKLTVSKTFAKSLKQELLRFCLSDHLLIQTGCPL